MRVLFAASECAPIVKTGGLADVIGALPGALDARGAEVRVLLPGYPAVLEALEAPTGADRALTLAAGPARVRSARVAGLDLLVLDAPALYGRAGGPYTRPDGTDWPDNHLRFSALAEAAACLARDGFEGWRPDVLHAHDWQAALAPVYLDAGGTARGARGANPDGPRPATVLTIHNIAFQGLYPGAVRTALGLPETGFTQDGYEFWGQVGFLKGGIAAADRITTVSPTYARELMTPDFGMGLDGLLRHRRGSLRGILNGIDRAAWDPETDPNLPAAFSARAPGGKQKARRALARRFGLDAGRDGPILTVVSRLTHQKGLDLLPDAIPGFLAGGGRLALLGTGDAVLERRFEALAEAHPGRVGAVIGFDEPLSHLMIGGADAILVPSRFEPCGLTQLYGLRYGTLPVVARTGGLADTVIDANPAALADGVATGIQLGPLDATSLADGLDRLLALWLDRAAWRRMMRRAMAQSWGWETSADAYLALYAEAIAERNGASDDAR